MKNVLNKFGIAIFTIILVWSCAKDDGPKAFANHAPVIYEQAFNLSGTITDAQMIGMVEAFDSNMGTKLIFSVITNYNDLFEIDKTTGSLSLKAGKELDLYTNPLQKVTVAVTDGEEEDSAKITICDCTPRFAQETYEFEVSEEISTAVLIHTFEVTDIDTDADDLIFGIPTNDNDLFEINSLGELSLAEGKSLDFENSQEHNITVSVTDGTEIVKVEVTITVTPM